MNRYDVIVVGARCAGSPAAMLLARRGYRVLVVDRATFPSDALSTHVVQPPACAALARWGLLERVVATGCPPVHTYTFDFGPFAIAGAPGTADSPYAYVPRRILLDKILLDAAAEAGAEIREGFSVDEVLMEDDRVVGIRGHSSGGATVTERATVVIGADGRHSLVARAVKPHQYNEKPPLQAGYYTYWSDLPVDGRFETFILAGRGFAAAPTNDGLTMVVAGWAIAQHEENKKDYERSYLETLAMSPAFAERLRGARRVDRLYGAATPNLFRTPYGPGWALIGDAGYNKDPITAQGISDAFHDAEGCAAALDRVLGGAASFDEAMGELHRARDRRALPMYDFTCQLAAMEPPPPEMQALLAAIHGNPVGMDRFVQMYAGVLSPADFFAPDHLASLMSGDGAPAAAGAS